MSDLERVYEITKIKSVFKHLEVGELFHVGKGPGMGCELHDKICYKIFRKTSQYRATIVKEINYHTESLVGHSLKFDPYERIWTDV